MAGLPQKVVLGLAMSMAFLCFILSFVEIWVRNVGHGYPPCQYILMPLIYFLFYGWVVACTLLFFLADGKKWKLITIITYGVANLFAFFAFCQHLCNVAAINSHERETDTRKYDNTKQGFGYGTLPKHTKGGVTKGGEGVYSKARRYRSVFADPWSFVIENGTNYEKVGAVSTKEGPNGTIRTYHGEQIQGEKSNLCCCIQNPFQIVFVGMLQLIIMGFALYVVITWVPEDAGEGKGEGEEDADVSDEDEEDAALVEDSANPTEPSAA